MAPPYQDRAKVFVGVTLAERHSKQSKEVTGQLMGPMVKASRFVKYAGEFESPSVTCKIADTPP